MGSSLRHLLIRAPNWVGDLVMATPVLEAALACGRFERVTVVCRKPLDDVLADGPVAEHVQVVGREDEAAAWRALGADGVLLLTNSFGAAWRAWRSGIRVRAGTSLSGRGFLLTHRIVPASRDGRRVPIPTAHLHRDLAGLVGIEVPSIHPRLHYSEEQARAMRASLAEVGLEAGEPYVLCAPSAAFGAAKLWPPEHFAAALDGIHERLGLRAVITGGPGEEPQMRAVIDACRHPALSLESQPRNLQLLKPLVAESKLLLVGDSGPRWYAAAFDVPCVSLMGPNYPELTATSLEHCRVLRVEGLECSPCLRRVCPLGHHRCMRELAPERAVRAAEELLTAQAVS